MVADVIGEAQDTTTRLLFTGNYRREYSPDIFSPSIPISSKRSRRFPSFLEDLQGKREPARAYSMSSSSHERYLAVTVKEERCVSGVMKFRRCCRRCSQNAPPGATPEPVGVYVVSVTAHLKPRKLDGGHRRR
jgi:hypothetical protein